MSVYNTDGLHELIEGLDDKTADLVRKAWYKGAAKNSLNMILTVEDLQEHLEYLKTENVMNPAAIEDLVKKCNNADLDQTLAELIPDEPTKPMPIRSIVGRDTQHTINRYIDEELERYMRKLTSFKLY